MTPLQASRHVTRHRASATDAVPVALLLIVLAFAVSPIIVGLILCVRLP